MDDLVFEAVYDEEAQVWFVSHDILGIVTEADTLIDRYEKVITKYGCRRLPKRTSRLTVPSSHATPPTPF